jgi:hypothetical protein
MLKHVITGHQDIMRECGISKIPKKGNIVEVGCNNGANSVCNFISSPSRYVGIDNQFGKIKEARKTFPDFTFFCMDCLSKKAKKIIKASDILVSFQTLEHIGTEKGDEDLKLLSLIRKNKKIIISVPNFDSRYHVRYYKEQTWTMRFETVMKIDELYVYKSPKKPSFNFCTFLYIGRGK